MIIKGILELLKDLTFGLPHSSTTSYVPIVG